MRFSLYLRPNEILYYRSGGISLSPSRQF